MSTTQRDLVFMARATKLAQNGRFTTDPNPRVGCVITKGNTIIGEGWHERAGADHAEIAALKDAGNAQGSTVYVTLEPCCHHGKTPPCSQALISAGVQRVVVAMTDPNPIVSGNGLRQLANAGIEVTQGILKAEAEALNPGFIKRMTQNRPWLRSKIAMSLDGRTALASGESKWITSHDARQDVHRLRAGSSAILTGVDTVLADDPSLSARVDFPAQQPVRVILDSALRTPPLSRMSKLPGRSLILTCCSDKVRIKTLKQAGFEIFLLPNNPIDKRLDLNAVLTFLSEQQMNEVLVEAGAVLNGALLAHRLIDELIVYMAPCILGDKGRGLFHIPGITTLSNKVSLSWSSVRQIGSDMKLVLKPINR